MKVLFVEDKLETIEIFQTELTDTSIILQVAKSKESALQLLESDNDFDLIVIDLQIPATEESLQKASETHGLAVYSAAKEKLPGTPIIIHSAYATLPLLQKPLQDCQRSNHFGTDDSLAMLEFIDKTKMSDCLAAIKEMANKLAELKSEVEIATGMNSVPLQASESYLLKRFARKRNCKRLSVVSLSGGLSAAKVLRIDTFIGDGGHNISAVGKLCSHEDAVDEHRRYQQSVTRLGVGTYAPLVELLVPGFARSAAIIYRLVDEYPDDFFDLLKKNPSAGLKSVQTLEMMSKPWEQGAVQEVKLQQIRKSLIRSETLEKISGKIDFDLYAYDDKEVGLRWCTQHRDLHGGNILVKSDFTPLFIDFGMVGEGPSCLDALTLELSLLFHPKGKQIANGWPSTKEAKNWADVDSYSHGSPFEEFIRACRTWAFKNIAAGSLGVYATAFYYALRQMKFDTADPDIILAVANSAKTAFDGN